MDDTRTSYAKTGRDLAGADEVFDVDLATHDIDATHPGPNPCRVALAPTQRLHSAPSAPAGSSLLLHQERPPLFMDYYGGCPDA